MAPVDLDAFNRNFGPSADLPVDTLVWLDFTDGKGTWYNLREVRKIAKGAPAIHLSGFGVIDKEVAVAAIAVFRTKQPNE